MTDRIETSEWVGADAFCRRRTTAAPEAPVPEMRLVTAVLEEALRCIGRYNPARTVPPREFRDAVAWFFDCEQEGPFAFETVCDLLKLNPAAVREQVRRRIAVHRARVFGASRDRQPTAHLVAPPADNCSQEDAA